MSYYWLLSITDDARDALRLLPKATRATVFRRLRQALEAEDPYALPFVEMLKDRKFERLRKFRAGDYRVLYIVELSPVIHQGFTYRGTLLVVHIGNRKDVY